ncbi:MAG: ATP-binding protein [Microcoleaceae cyanobacterium]
MIQGLITHGDLLLGLIDRAGRLVWVNLAFAEYTGRLSEELIGQKFFNVLTKNSQEIKQQTQYIRERLIKGEDFKFEFTEKPSLSSTPLNQPLQVSKALLVDGQPIIQTDNIITRYTLLITDISLRKQTELKLRETKDELEAANLRVLEEKRKAEAALEELQITHSRLIQTEKMSTLGQLIAGIAHEINNPIGFLAGNLDLMQDSVADLLHLLDLYQEKWTTPDPSIVTMIEEIELDYLREDLPKLLNSMQLGIDRIREVSQSLRTLSRNDSGNRPSLMNLNEGIDGTLLILQHRLKANNRRPEIQVIRDYGDLPEISCYPGPLNQVFMNLIANAIDALEEANQARNLVEIKANPNQITIQTELNLEHDQVKVIVADNGSGISEEIKQNIFEYLFTTKEAGKGTGFGLAISQEIIRDKHGGQITVDSEPGKGSKFTITLPLQAPD